MSTSIYDNYVQMKKYNSSKSRSISSVSVYIIKASFRSIWHIAVSFVFDILYVFIQASGSSNKIYVIVRNLVYYERRTCVLARTYHTRVKFFKWLPQTGDFQQNNFMEIILTESRRVSNVASRLCACALSIWLQNSFIIYILVDYLCSLCMCQLLIKCVNK